MERSKKLLEEWVRKDMIQAMKDREMPGDLIDKLPDGLVTAVTEEMIKHNPRKLYDFFDENGINIFLEKSKIAHHEGVWGYKIEDLHYETNATGRVSTEEVAFREAFKIMDDAK